MEGITNQPELVKQQVKLSIRALCEFVLKSGSLDNRFGGPERAQEGSRIHRKLQKAGGEWYRAEVYLKTSVPYGDFVFTVEGRADGVVETGRGFMIDEIKTTSLPIEMIDEDYEAAHWGQAMTYAYLYAKDNSLGEMEVQLTYYQIDTGQIKRFQRRFSFSQLELFFADLLKQYHFWAKLRADWQGIRNQSIQSLAFPFEHYREGQRGLAAAVYRTVRDSGRLFCQAPTGIGKTMSTLYPAIKAMGEGEGERIFYLTAKTITRQAAEEAFALMRGKGLRVKTITLTAKDKICFLEQRDCNPETCPYANGYFDRVKDALKQLLEGGDEYTRQSIEQAAKAHTVCPYELSLDLSLWADAIVCDYNYLFDPVVYLKRFFADGGGDYTFLIDEAHNLVDRARSMYSAELNKSDFLSLKKALGKENPLLAKALGQVNTVMVALRKQCTNGPVLVQKEPFDDALLALQEFAAFCDEWLAQQEESPFADQVLELYFAVSFFLRIAELYDGHYVNFLYRRGSELSWRQLCLDPSDVVNERLSWGRAAVLFSATLSPLDYFVSVLGGGEDTKRFALPSPFKQQNLCLLAADHISTRYRDRPESYEPIARLLYAMVTAKEGNYIAYFPSYQYLSEVFAAFQNICPQVQTLVQTSGMDEAQREDFLARFEKTEGTLLAFCVMGGIYGEGIDLKGDKLIGTAIVGVGLPQVGPQQDVLRDYFEEDRGQGFQYAYQYPGFNKVLQAAGRVIRGETDRGVVLLIDSRFTSPSYRQLWPAHWSHLKRVRGEDALQTALGEFWNAR